MSIKFVEDRSRVSKTRVRAPTSPPEAHTVLPDGSHRNSCLANATMTVCVCVEGEGAGKCACLPAACDSMPTGGAEASPLTTSACTHRSGHMQLVSSGGTVPPRPLTPCACNSLTPATASSRPVLAVASCPVPATASLTPCACYTRCCLQGGFGGSWSPAYRLGPICTAHRAPAGGCVPHERAAVPPDATQAHLGCAGGVPVLQVSGAVGQCKSWKTAMPQKPVMPQNPL